MVNIVFYSDFIPSNLPQSSLSSHKSQSNIRTEADRSIILLIYFPHAAEPLPSVKQGFLNIYMCISRLDTWIFWILMMNLNEYFLIDKYLSSWN